MGRSGPQNQRGRPTKPRGSIMGTKGVGYGQQGGRYLGCKGNCSTIELGGITKVVGLDLA